MCKPKNIFVDLNFLKPALGIIWTNRGDLIETKSFGIGYIAYIIAGAIYIVLALLRNTFWRCCCVPSCIHRSRKEATHLKKELDGTRRRKYKARAEWKVNRSKMSWISKHRSRMCRNMHKQIWKRGRRKTKHGNEKSKQTDEVFVMNRFTHLESIFFF